MNAPQTYVQTSEAKTAYDARWKRIMDCVNFKTPDRMPTSTFCKHSGWPSSAAWSHAQLMYDYDKAKELGERVLREFEPDVHNPLLLNVAAGPALEAVDYKQLIWPGHGVRDDQPYQIRSRIHEGG